MNVLITGSSGQIGTNVALKLMDRGDAVLGIDKRENTWTDRIETRIRDLTDVPPGDLDLNLKPDVVLHFAANAKVFELVEYPERAMDNVKMLFNVLDYCRRSSVPIFFSSSREVYGDIHRHVTDESSADFVVAESPYSASKIAGEAMIYSYFRCYGLPHLVVRFSNVYGRYDNDIERMERVIPLFVDRISRNIPIVVFGKEKVLDFTYVDDAVRGVIAGIDSLVSESIRSETINLASGQGRTLQDVVNLISLGLGVEPRVTYERARAGEVTHYVADLTKARELLGYEPDTPLTSGLPLAIKWQRESGSVAG
ncbi:MAG: NAD-dependent epimerase/dehydratase family protein [Phycisphaerae bacterium]